MSSVTSCTSGMIFSPPPPPCQASQCLSSLQILTNPVFSYLSFQSPLLHFYPFPDFYYSCGLFFKITSPRKPSLTFQTWLVGSRVLSSNILCFIRNGTYKFMYLCSPGLHVPQQQGPHRFLQCAAHSRCSVNVCPVNE